MKSVIKSIPKGVNELLKGIRGGEFPAKQVLIVSEEYLDIKKGYNATPYSSGYVDHMYKTWFSSKVYSARLFNKLVSDYHIIFISDYLEYDWRWLIGFQFVFLHPFDSYLVNHIENVSKELRNGFMPNYLCWDVYKGVGATFWHLPNADDVINLDLTPEEWEWEFSIDYWSKWDNDNFKRDLFELCYEIKPWV